MPLISSPQNSIGASDVSVKTMVQWLPPTLVCFNGPHMSEWTSSNDGTLDWNLDDKASG